MSHTLIPLLFLRTFKGNFKPFSLQKLDNCV